MLNNKSNIFSVIVPIFNVENLLPRCLKSIENQTFKNYELILVDDGSTDNCPQIIDDYAKSHDNVKVIHKKNGGLASARNAGLRLSSGSYILYIDSDDYCYPTLLESCKNRIEQKECDLIIFNYDELVLHNGEPVISKPKTSFPYEEGLYKKDDLVNEVYPSIFEMRSVLSC